MRYSRRARIQPSRQRSRALTRWSRWLLVPALSLFSLPPASGTLSPSRALTFEERVEAQKAIERVYDAGTDQTTLPFERAVPREVIEKKVTRYLRQSAALDEVWKTPVTATMLQREWERIARDTRASDRLFEVYGALGNDSVLIQECFVRSALVERLTRSLFQGYFAQHAAARARAESLAAELHGNPSLRPDGPNVRRKEVVLQIAEPGDHKVIGHHQDSRAEPEGRSPREPLEITTEEMESWRRKLPARAGEVSAVDETQEAFSIRVLGESDAKHIRFTQVDVAKESWESWWNLNQERFDAAVPVVSVAILPPESGKTGSTASQDLPHADGATLPPARLHGVHVREHLGQSPFQLRPGRSRGAYGRGTGSLMLVWGGAEGYGFEGAGERYDPVIDTCDFRSTRQEHPQTATATGRSGPGPR